MPTREPDGVCGKLLCPILWDFLEIPEVFLKEVTSVNNSGAPARRAGSAWVPQTLQPYTGGTLPLASALPHCVPFTGAQFCTSRADGHDLTLGNEAFIGPVQLMATLLASR